MKLRIAAAAAAGILLIGILGWPIAAPQEPLGIVSLPGLRDGFVLIILAFFTGVLGYFFSWPYGREIGILAVPAGLCVWAVRGGSIASVMQQHPALADRQAFFSTLRWESFFWLAVVFAGFVGVLICQIIAPVKPKILAQKSKTRDKEWKPNIFISVFGVFLGPIVEKKFAALDRRLEEWKLERGRSGTDYIVKMCLNSLISLGGAGIIAHIFISMLAQDVRLPDKWLGTVVAQPAKGQIVFAVIAGFGAAAFAVKKFLDSSYIWPASASVLLMLYACFRYAKPEVLRYVAQEHPANFFCSALVCILPVQMVTLAAIGSVAGYWLAVRFNYWREHEID